jgi:DNA-binding transcriptional MerR regulator
MRIGELAEATGASVRALRYYEEQGLLESDRSTSGQRLYGPHAVERVRWLKGLYSAGMPSATIAKLRPCHDRGEVTEVEEAIVAAERAKIEAKIQELTAVRDRLDAMMGGDCAA